MTENHVILCGLGRVGWHVLELLKAAGTPVVVIDTRCAADDPRLAGVTLIQGDSQKQTTLEKANVSQARAVVILPSDELASISTALMVRRLNPTTRIVVRMFNQNLVSRLGGAISNVVALSTSALAAPLLALIARTGDALGTFRLDDGALHQIADVTFHENSPQCGKTIGDLLEDRQFLILAHTRDKESRQLHQIDLDAIIQPGDHLVVCGEAAALAPLTTQDEEDSLPELLWAGFVRRFSRVALRTVSEIDLPVKICTSILLVVIVASTLVFHVAIANETLPDALYRTISLMATGADMGGRELPPGGWEKVFVSLLRLAGAALTAAFTAILTNYLVRAQLSGALEARRIPDSGHVIVCGIGNVGFRVVEELLRQGEKVVAIERERDNAFIATARRQGVPVIIGDATLPEVLKQARAGTARAVIAATSKELINLEIGLLVRELNPKQRVVLLMVDPQLARTVREAAEIRLAVSIPALAAPAFVAAILGDRVRSVFLVGGKLLAVVDVTAPADDAFLAGQSVRALAVDYNMLPIRLWDAAGKTRAEPLNARLSAGDHMTMIVGLNDLQRLLRREPPPRTWTVEATECPLPARDWLTQLVRTQRRLNAVDTIAEMPCCVGEELTRGQAEDLMYLMGRERVGARVTNSE
ncbi:MAG TPA: NAD-binding protein [Gemmataceae bacterium]|nr:NAD-binding protein [Gemmataceae bacterium]